MTIPEPRGPHSTSQLYRSLRILTLKGILFSLWRRFPFKHDEILEKGFAHTTGLVSTVPTSSCYNSAPRIHDQVEAETQGYWSGVGKMGWSKRVWCLLRDAVRASCQDQLLLSGPLPGWAKAGIPTCRLCPEHRPGPPVPPPRSSGLINSQH